MKNLQKQKIITTLTTLNIKSFAIIAILISVCFKPELALSKGYSEQQELVKAKNIVSVRNAISQSCTSAGAYAATEGHKDFDNIKKSGEIALKELGFKFIIPQFLSPDHKSNYQDTYVTMLLNDKSRGILDNYIWISDQNFKGPFAALVISELPEKFQTTEAVFQNVKMHHELQISGKKIDAIERIIESARGPILEIIVKDRVGSNCFPTSTYNMLPKGYKISTFAVSRFIFIDKKLIEFSLVTVTPKSYSRDKAITSARKQMDSFMLSLTPFDEEITN